MNTVLIYMAKAAFYMAAFYLVYFAFLKNDTLYGRNRAYILLSVLTAFIMPLITIKTNNPVNIPVFGKTLNEIIVYGYTDGATIITKKGIEIDYQKIFWYIYLAGVIIFGVKLAIDFAELLYLILRKKTRNSHIIHFQGFNTAGFSALGHVFVNTRLTPQESAEIIKHEQNHIDKNHFADIALIEILSIFHWFNPFIHMFNRSLRAVHEFQADEGCLQNGISICNYQNLLLNQVFRSNIFNLTNCFSNPTLIKKRMIMMTRKRSRALANLKVLLVFPVAALAMVAFSSYTEISETEQNLSVIKVPPETTGPEQILPAPVENIVADNGFIRASEQNNNTNPPPPPPPPARSQANNSNAQTGDNNSAVSVTTVDNAAPTEVFVIVEEMPQFPGGEVEMMNFIYSNVKYPETAKENNIQGRVFLRFCVTYKGAVDQISVLKGVDPELDAEAMRVVALLPQWEPGKQGGKPVNVWFQLPITFQLKQ